VNADIILAALLALPQYAADAKDTPEERHALVRPVAEAIHAATKDRTERAFLAVQAWYESGLARYVLEDRCHEGPVGAQCDAGRATGPWQVHAWCKAAWSGTTAERYLGGARCALSLWRAGNARCRGPHGGFAANGGILGSCSKAREKWARRVMNFERVRGQL
jgi:hypothetical protein